MSECKNNNFGHRYSRAMNQEYPRKCINCNQPESVNNMARETEEVLNQYIYFNGRDFVCGVRLYKSDEEWKKSHPGLTYIKKIEHEIKVSR